MWADPALILAGQVVPEVCSKSHVPGANQALSPLLGRGGTMFECGWKTQPLVHHLWGPIRHCMAAMGGMEGALGCPQDSESVFPEFTTPRAGQAKLGKPCSTQGPVTQPGREALLHLLELFTCRALLQHLEVRAPGSSAGAFLHNKAMGCSFILFSLPYYQ